MDPYHITEFASPRYFQKLHEQEQQHHGGEAAPTPFAEAGPSSAVTQQGPSDDSPFILPLRQQPSIEPTPSLPNIQKVAQQKRKRGIFKILSRGGVGSKPSSSEENQPPRILRIPIHVRERPSVSEAVPEFAPRPPQLDELFTNLPNELQVQVIAALPLSDILQLRLVSRSWHALITENEAPIVRYHLDRHIPTYAKRLYPIKRGEKLTLHYLCGLWHRLHVAAKLSFLICHWVTKDIFLQKTDSQLAEFAPQRERMRRRMIPLVFTIYHFFEQYREKHLEYIKKNGYGLSKTPFTFNPLELEIMEQYDPHTLLRVHEIFPVVIAAYGRRMRPPTYIGRVEGAFRGYLRSQPPDEVHATVLLVGGLWEAEHNWEVKGYNARIEKVEKWFHNLHGLTGDIPKKRAFPRLTRKKSVLPEPTTMPDRQAGARVLWGQNLERFPLRSSLTDGKPMGPLHKDDLKLLLDDLPTLQQIWAITAEGLILEKGIVDTTLDIRRNAQVMLELIRDCGWDDEDEWWYGRSDPGSLQLRDGAMDDDI